MAGEPNDGRRMTLDEARQILELAPKATRQEIRAAYRLAARLWHPDRAPAGAEAEHRARMQQINNAYQLIVKYIEAYRYDLVEPEESADFLKWWTSRFYTGVWGPPRPPDDEDK
jgi:DnaJ-class molecular chaperone